MGCALPKGSTVMNRNTRVMLDARIDPTPSPIVMNALDCMTYFLHCGDRLTCNHEEPIFFLILFPSYSCVVSNLASLWRASLMHLSMHITITVEMSKILGTSGTTWKEEFDLWLPSLLLMPMHTRRHVQQDTCLRFRLLKPNARYPHLPIARSAIRQRGSDFRGWAIFTDGGTRSVNGETCAGWGVIAESPRRSIDIMFGPVVTKETHPAFSRAKASSNNTAEMTAIIKALYFLGPRRSIARHEEACIFCDSTHAAGICLGTIQARSHVQVPLACQRYTLCVQHRLRLTMHHVYGHAGNLGNECADHAAALGSLGLISSHNDAARWGRHNFDTHALCEGCNNTSEILERLDHAKQKQQRENNKWVS